MPNLVVLVPNENTGFPPIMEAAMCYPKAVALGCDRIRVERVSGVMVTEYPLTAVARFIESHGLVMTPGKVLKQDRDWESRRPVWAGYKPRQGDSHGSE